MRSATRKAGNRKRRPGRLWAPITFIAILAILAAIALASERRAQIPVVADNKSHTPTTAWPHGQPEYILEVPEGYEGLLPPQPVSPSPARVDPGEARKTGSKVQAETYISTTARKTGASVPTLIIVIDDVGYNVGELEPFLALPFPLTVAILPGVDHTEESARLAAAAGKEIILHQPMEALGGQKTGPGAIMLGMDSDAAGATLAANLASLPQAVGVNNHMGSAVTRDARLMRAMLELVKARGIYYLDSLTAPGTATAGLSAELYIPLWERDVFLDNSGDRQSILRALDDGKKLASNRGASVLIGHVWSAELAQTLMDVYPRLVEEGYSLSTISKFMMRSAAENDDARPGD